MKKRSISLFLALALLLALAAPVAAAGGVRIALDGKALSLNPKPFIQRSRTMVPLRALAEAMGYTVTWQGGHGIRVCLEHKTLGIHADLYQEGGSHWLRRDNRAAVPLDIAPVIVNNHTFIPLRTFAQTFDYQVAWDATTATVTLTDLRTVPMLDEMAADTAFSLLENRLHIKMPAAAFDMPVQQGGLVGHKPDTTYERNLTLAENGQIFTLTARELYAYSTGDLQKDMQHLLPPGGSLSDYTISAPVRAGNIEFLPYTVNVYDEARGGVIAGALVRAADRTLITITVQADRFAMAYAAQCHAMADTILRSLQAGTRTLEVAKHTVNIGAYNISLLPGYVSYRNTGADFDVYYAYKLAPLDQICSNFGIYFGDHPSASNRAGAQSVPDAALGRPINWTLYAQRPGQFDHDTYAETLVETGTTGRNSYLHVFATPVTADDWADIRAMVRTIS